MWTRVFFFLCFPKRWLNVSPRDVPGFSRPPKRLWFFFLAPQTWPSLIIDTDVTFACWCSSDSWHGSTSGTCSGSVLSHSQSESWTHVHSTAAHIRPGLEKSCCTFSQTFPKCQFCHCRSRSLVIFQSRPSPWQRGLCARGFRAPGVGGQPGERRGCCPCSHK